MTHFEKLAHEKSAMDFWDKADLAAGAASFVPGIGGAINGIYNGGRSLYHLFSGNKGKAAESAAYALAGLIPGGIAAAKGAKGLSMAGRAAQAAGQYGRAGQLAGKAFGALGRGTNSAVQGINRASQAYNGLSTGGKVLATGGLIGGGSAAGSGIIPGLGNVDDEATASPQAIPFGTLARSPGGALGRGGIAAYGAVQ